VCTFFGIEKRREKKINADDKQFIICCYTPNQQEGLAKDKMKL
jgi:hypothetical protein